jgi:hypothetical protein
MQKCLMTDEFEYLDGNIEILFALELAHYTLWNASSTDVDDGKSSIRHPFSRAYHFRHVRNFRENRDNVCIFCSQTKT